MTAETDIVAVCLEGEMTRRRGDVGTAAWHETENKEETRTRYSFHSLNEKANVKINVI